MKYLNTYENWFTNIFKTGDDMWQDYMDSRIGQKVTPRWNSLFGAASEGNWKRFKNLLPKHIKHINDVIIQNDELSISHLENLLILISRNRDIGTWEKKKMITALIDNNVDISFRTSEGEDFYDLMDPKIKTWFKQKYPEIVEKLELYKKSNKYNL